LDKFPLKWIDSYEGISYLETKDLLEDIYNKSDKSISCLPVIKVVEDNLIIGIITKTNQFILVNPPEIDTFGDDLEIINNSNYNLIDKNIMSNKIDEKRLEYVKKIKMESDFYINFRNTVRLELGNYKNKKYRLEIELILNNKELTYFNKLKRVETLLKKLLKNLVKFIEIENILLQNIEDITMCNKLSSDKCDENVFCLTEDDTCKLLIPSINLINEENNERLYFGRLSDELVRYNRIRAFILEPKVFLNFSNIKYNLLDSEIILLESLIEEYFTDLIIETDNKYITFNTYDTAEPQKSQTYSNIVIKENIDDIEKENYCNIIESKISDSKGNKWRNIFPRGSKELSFGSQTDNCTFDIILKVIQETKDKDMTKERLRSILSEEYVKLFNKDNKKIMSILKKQGKPKLIKLLEKKEVDVATLFMINIYYLSMFDLWILADKLDLPLILYKTGKFLESDDKILVLNKSVDNKYSFIKVPATKLNEYPKYKLLEYDNKYLLDISLLPDDIQRDILNQIDNEKNILEVYINNFKPNKLKIVKNLTKTNKLNKKVKLKLKEVSN
jgi:hypothetical protein